MMSDSLTIIYSPDTGACSNVEDPLGAVILGTETQPSIQRETEEMVLEVCGEHKLV